MSVPRLPEEKGAIAWMARNHVAANLLMFSFVVGGIALLTTVKQEVFPEFDLDMIQVTVPYPGASPAEIERGIILAIEEKVNGLDGIKKVTATANEGFGSVMIELLLGTDENKALQDVKNAIDRIVSFPEEAERPEVRLLIMRREVVTLVIYGDQEESVLRKLSEKVRYDLLQDPDITQVEISGTRDPEISIEVKQETLRKYNLTLGEIAARIRRAALELPAGTVKTRKGEILLRTMERRYTGLEFEDLVVISRPDGTKVELGAIATIIDGFTDTDKEAFYNGRRAAIVKCYRVGDQTPQQVSDAVKAYTKNLQKELPENVQITLLNDWSKILKQRMELLMKNFFMGLVLVMLLLGLFLEPKLAFWVMLGIPISIFGCFLFIKPLDISINMVSLFAFIITLGIIVDDAIIVGENTYEYRKRGMPFLKSAIQGAQFVIVPITFSILTNMVAFLPLLFVPGMMGKFFKVIPLIVIPIFLVSWVECLFILPSHLAHQKKVKHKGAILKLQGKVANLMDWFRFTIYAPFLQACLKQRYLTIAIGFALLLLTLGFVVGGHIDFVRMPRIDGDRVTATVSLPVGVNVEETKKVQERFVASAQKVAAEIESAFPDKELLEGIFTIVGGTFSSRSSAGRNGSHLCAITVYLHDAGERAVTAAAFKERWRKNIGPVAGIESMKFDYTVGGSAGASIDIQLTHPSTEILEKAATELAERLKRYDGVTDIDDGYSGGKAQLDLKVSPVAHSLGITANNLAAQVRSFYYGAEALRQQRGRDEVKVMVRLPFEQRRSEYHLENLLIRTPGGGEIPFAEAAVIKEGRSYTQINRADGRRVLNVTAETIEGVANANKVITDVQKDDLPPLIKKYKDLNNSFEGEQREQRESNEALMFGFALSLFAIYILLAVPFKSYIQPVVVMFSIPFGIVGATLGHLIMGYNISTISIMGIIALSGVVVNDSLVLIDYANRRRQQGSSIWEAISSAGVRRFRPIILTSLTTFMGLAPMIFETSIQARFLIPMAVSLGFGILFATGIALLLIPCLYVVLYDFLGFWAKAAELTRPEPQPADTDELLTSDGESSE